MRLSIIILLLGVGLRLWASDIVTVHGESTYYDDGSKSRAECMRLAAEQARIDALSKAFGTIVTQDILQSDRVFGSREHNYFLMLSSTEVKGEWIADEGDPTYEFSHDLSHNLIVKCKIRGKAREITNEGASFEASVLRNGTDLRHADNLFRDGDDMFLYFKSSEDGYMTAFLEDEGGNVYMVLPYPRDTKSRVFVKRDTPYVFFSRDNARETDPQGVIEELVLTAPDRVECNRLYVIFSTESFSRPIMDSTGELPTIKRNDFNKWLLKSRSGDTKMGVKAMNLQISPR